MVTARDRQKWLATVTGPAPGTGGVRGTQHTRWEAAHHNACTLLSTAPESTVVFARMWVNGALARIQAVLDGVSGLVEVLEGVYLPVPPTDPQEQQSRLRAALPEAATPSPAEVQRVQTAVRAVAVALRPSISSGGRLMARGTAAASAFASGMRALRQADQRLRTWVVTLPETTVPPAARAAGVTAATAHTRGAASAQLRPDTLHAQVYGVLAASSALAAADRLREWNPSGRARLAIGEGGRVEGTARGTALWEGAVLSLLEGSARIDPRTLTVKAGDLWFPVTGQAPSAVVAVTASSIQVASAPPVAGGVLRPALGASWVALEEALLPLHRNGIPALPTLTPPDSAAQARACAQALMRWCAPLGPLSDAALASADRQALYPPDEAPTLYSVLHAWTPSVADSLQKSVRAAMDGFRNGGFDKAADLATRGQLTALLALPTEEAARASAGRRGMADAGLINGRQRT